MYMYTCTIPCIHYYINTCSEFICLLKYPKGSWGAYFHKYVHRSTKVLLQYYYGPRLPTLMR